MVKTRHSIVVDEEPPERFLSLRSGRPSGTLNGESKTDGYSSSDESEAEVVHHRYGTRHAKVSPIHRKSTPDETVKNPVENGQDDSIRRSGRNRKLLYDSFNQSLLGYVSSSQTTTEAGENGPSQNNNAKKKDEEEEEGGEFNDMYSRVKRIRKKSTKRDMYGMPLEDDKTTEEENSSEEEEEEDQEEEEEDSQQKSYHLREHKPRTQFYEVPVEEHKLRKKKLPDVFQESNTPPRPRKHKHKKRYASPAVKKRRRATFHGSSSTSSSSDSSSDERKFERRKAKSMTKSRNRCLPMNLTGEDVSTGLLRDRARSGASLADVDPMSIDKSVTFESVGGLGKHVRSLKEMIVFPLLYPEVFQRFKIQPPRGCLFHGPPGTGKTLVARALANECSQGDRRVAFFMRKGADCLSKWVGESERQLRLLFDQAYQMRPSIIFFDEIDGLAPVRSSRQDQIHSSIVSTLLALMDGLDARGEIVVIGATNRIDSIDPALRRPGRFDREFMFPLPSSEARTQILSIHTKDWKPKLAEGFIKEVAEKCVGYCGADIKALCTEAALNALKRRYPQIYLSNEKLQLDVNAIQISAWDFHKAMRTIVPASQRAVVSPGRILSQSVQPLLSNSLVQALEMLKKTFPVISYQLRDTEGPGVCNNNCSDASDEAYSDGETGPSIFENKVSRKRLDTSITKPYMDFHSGAYQAPSANRPRLLVAGQDCHGQSTHLGPALLHSMERFPVHVLDLPALFAVSAKTPEESCAQIFREARRTCPSIIYVPHINTWWDVIGEALKATFLTMLNDLEPSSPLLLLATSEETHSQLPSPVQELFSSSSGEVYTMQSPTDAERRAFFEDILLNQPLRPPVIKKSAVRSLEVLPHAPPPQPRKLTDVEMQKLWKQEEGTLRELRLFLRSVLNKLARDRKFNIFAKPVDIDDAPDYYEIISEPMDLGSMMSNIDEHRYQCVAEFMEDIGKITNNALEYNPAKDPTGRAIRHRACALKDTAAAIIDNELDPDFEQMCKEIVESRKRRGETPRKSAPDFIYTKPLNRPMMPSFTQHVPPPIPDNAVRYSRRVRGIEVVGTPPPSSDTNGRENKAKSPESNPGTPKKSAKRRGLWFGSRRKRRRATVPNANNNESGEDSGAGDEEAEMDASTESGAVEEEQEAGHVERPRRASTPMREKTPQRDTTPEREKTPVRGLVGKLTSVFTGGEELAPHCDTAKLRSRLVTMLDKLVIKTRSLGIENLERLHSSFRHCIYQHRKADDKTQLVKDLESTAERFFH